ncbi:MAG: SPOR domain-containing protein [Gammaproteobacteria bacterium]
MEPAVGPISAHDGPSQDLAPDRGSQVRGPNQNTRRSLKLPEAETLSDRASVDASPAAGWVVQLASFSREANAKTLRAKLVARGFGAFIEKTTTTRSSMYRVRVGPTSGRQQAQDLRAALQQAVSLQGVVVRYH